MKKNINEPEKLAAVASSDLLACPWCKDTDFDEVGLKLHVNNGHCDAFNELNVSLPQTRMAALDSEFIITPGKPLPPLWKVLENDARMDAEIKRREQANAESSDRE